ncbi:hypothetical protein [Bradyrhizobium commune]|uniref:hypothetical protein n=1 Tax=Bradyrhizobium commune TaxID=83627 RepID=UPI001FF01E39|nr:hypothetical protein [Bradyrhizobium commune]
MPIEPPEIPPATPGTPTEPPPGIPPGNPQPDIAPPVREPGSPPRPDELPGHTPEEIPSRGPSGPLTPNPATDAISAVGSRISQTKRMIPCEAIATCV